MAENVTESIIQQISEEKLIKRVQISDSIPYTVLEKLNRIFKSRHDISFRVYGGADKTVGYGDDFNGSYDELLERIQLPISYDEAEVLVQIFPESSFYDLQWNLLKLVESVIRIDDGDKFIQLINAYSSQEWKDVLNIRYKNYKKSQEV